MKTAITILLVVILLPWAGVFMRKLEKVISTFVINLWRH